MRWSLPCAALAIMQSGCVMETTHTQLAVARLEDVSLLSDQAKLGPGESQATLRESAFAPEPGALTRYSLVATRAADGTLAFEWKLGAPLVNGEHQTVLDPAMLERDAPPWYLAPDVLRQPALRLTGCAALRRETAKGTLVGYRATEWQRCDDTTVAVPFSLETPWSNVKELHQRVVPEKGLALGLFITNTLLFGGLGALFVALPRTQVLGWTFVGISGALDLLIVPTFFARERDTIVYP